MAYVYAESRGAVLDIKCSLDIVRRQDGSTCAPIPLPQRTA
jgi:hypothetical protein